MRIVVPFPPGAGVDITSRLFAAKLSEALGQQFVVENRSGASSAIDADFVAHSKPDGYTLLSASASTASSQSMYRKLRYHLARDFEPIALPGFESGSWFALMAPSGTPREVVMLLNAAVEKVGQIPEVRDRLIASGADPLSGPPEQVGAYVKNEIAKWAKVIAAAGVQPEE